MENRNGVELRRKGEKDPTRKKSMDQIRAVTEPNEEGRIAAGLDLGHFNLK